MELGRAKAGQCGGDGRMTPDEIRQMAYETWVFVNWNVPQKSFSQEDMRNAFFAGWNERPDYDT